MGEEKKLISLTAWKRKIKREMIPFLDLQPDETSETWMDAYLSALEEDGLVIRKGKRTYIIED